MSDNPSASVRVELMHPETDAPTWWQEWDGKRVSTGPLPGADPDAGDPDDWSCDGGSPELFEHMVPEEVAAEIVERRSGSGLDARIVTPNPGRALVAGPCPQCHHEPLYDRPGYRRIRWVDRSGGEAVERSEIVRCRWTSHWQEERTCPAIVRAHEERCERAAEEHQAALLAMSNEAIRGEVAAANEGIEDAHRAANGKWTEALHDRHDAESARYDRALAELRRREGTQ